jgi:hypothetical protein
MSNRSNNIYEELYNFKIVHGRAGVGYFMQNNFSYTPKISSDIKIVMITNSPHQNQYNKLYTNKESGINIEYIILNTEKFRCGIDLIEPLYNYIKTINEKYILYMDASDTIIVNDIEDPQALLDTYKCKILFNAEDEYFFPDHPCVDKTYTKKYAEHNNEPQHFYYEERLNRVVTKNSTDLQNKTNCAPYRKSLNAGLFLGERKYMVEVLEKMLRYMYDDPTKGYPYGEIENQKLWQYMQSQCENGEIEIDYYNLYLLWIHGNKFDVDIDNQWHFNYFYNNFYKKQHV